MKRFVLLILIFGVFSGLFISRRAFGEPNPGTLQTGRIKLVARNAVLVDQKTGEVIYDKNGREKCYPASTTKILTALTAIEYADPVEKVTVRDAANFAALDSSKAGIVYGERLSLEQLLNAMLIPSGNDAAYAIAAYIGKKTAGGKSLSEREAVDRFRVLMNEKAEEIGANDSRFINPDGYQDESHYTTACDMALIAREFMNNETLCKIVKQSGYNLPDIKRETPNGDDTRERYLENTNRLIMKGDPCYYKACTGLKTGHTDEAGYCLVASGEKNGIKVIAVIMGSSEDGVWADAQKLLDYGLNCK